MLAKPVALRRWAWAVIVPAVVIVGVLVSRPLLDKAPFTSLLAAVLFVAWHGGRAPALLATALSMMFAMFFYLAPRGTLQVSSPSDTVGLVVFFAVALFAGRVTARVREAMRREQVARTDAERQHQEAEELRRQAETSNRAKDEFLAMLGHELRNPLEAIAVAVGVLKRAGRTEEQTLRAQQVITRQVGHLRDLTDDLLDVARLTTGKITLSCQPVDLAEVALHWWNLLESTGTFRRHRARIDAGPAWVEGDETRLVQVVENLLGNAVKYTPPDGEIRVTTGVEGDDAVLRVSDTGIGIDTDLLPRVFDLFVQGEQGSHRPKRGLGIGLTLVKRLVEIHGGQVVAASRGPGRGSTFEVRLPRIPPPMATPSRPPILRVGAGRVLIVEDDADSREMLRLALELDGHEVHVADNGLAGVQMALSVRPEVVIVDLGLPGIDGYEVARRIRATEAGRRMRLITLSGYGQPEDRRRSREAGFDVHLVKPVDDRTLAEAIQAPPRPASPTSN